MGEDPTALVPSETPKKRGRAWKRWVLPPLALLGLFCLTVYALTGTGPGLRLALGFAEGPIAAGLDGEFSVKGVSGSLWSDLRVEALTLSLPDGLTVEADSLHLAWRPSALLGGRLVVDTVGAESLSVSIPESAPAEPVEEDSETAFEIPQLPVGVAVRQLLFPSVRISLPDGAEYQASVLGDVETTEKNEICTTVEIAAAHDGKSVDRVSLKGLVTSGDNPEMTLDLSAEVPTDGVLFAILDLPAELTRPLTATLNGKGVLSAWSGEVRLEAQGLAALTGAVGLGMTDVGMHVSFDGAADLHDPAALSLPGGLAGRYEIEIPDFALGEEELAVADLTVVKDGLVDIAVTARMALDASDLSADGRVNLAPGATEIFDIPVRFSAAQIGFQGGGTLPDIAGGLEISAQGVEGFGNRVQGLKGVVSLNGSLNDGFAVDTDISAAGMSWSDDALAQVLGKTVVLKAKAAIDPTFQVFDGIEVSVAPLGATLRTGFRIDGGGLIAERVQVDLADLSRLQPLAGVPIAGGGTAVLSALSLAEDGTISTEFNIGANRLSVVDDQISAMVGSSPSLKGDLHLSETDGLVLSLHDLRAKAGVATGIVMMTSDFAELSGEVSLRALASALPQDAGLSVDGNVIDVTARFAGPVEKPNADVTVSPFAGAAAGTAMQVDALEAQLRWREQSPFVTFQGAGAAMGVAASLEGGAAIGPDDLDVPGIAVTGQGWSAWAAATLPGFALPAEGSARIVVSDASPFAGLAGLAGLAGQATVDAQFAAGGTAGAQAVTATVSSAGISVQPSADAAPVNVGKIDISAAIGDALALQDIDATIAIDGVTGDGFNISEIGLTLQGTGEAVEGDLTVAGADPTPVSLSSHLAARLRPDGVSELRVTELDLAYAGLEQLVTGAADASIGPGDALSATVDLNVLSGKALAAFARGNGAARLTLDIADIPLGPIAELQGQKDVEGLLNAKAELTQQAGPVSGGFSVTATGLRTEDLDKDIGLDLLVEGEALNDRINLLARSAGTGLDDISVRAALPVALSLVEPGAAIDGAGALEGLVKANIKLREIWPYLPLPEHSVSGSMNADVKIGGTFDRPVVEGAARLNDGEYEHLVHGTLIKNIQGGVQFAGENFTIDGLAGDDPYGGSFKISGRGSLAGGTPVFDIATKLNTLRVVNSDAVKADVDADVKSVQKRDGMLVQGQVLIKRAEVNLGVALPPSIATLEVEDGTEPETTAADNAETSTIALDLTIDAPGQIFVRGRGLESEWEGNVRVAGTAQQPIVSGGLKARRGRIDVIGKGFTLDDSTIKFFGGETIDPVLGINGIHEGDDITVIASLEGNASSPEITLSSQPPLPEDEVLSRLLFGKTSSSLSPLEAAQLAASASELAGGGSGVDVLGTIRDFVGVDVLEVDTSGEEAAVKAGTYLTDGVFVGAKQGAAPGSSAVTVEVEVTPNISVTTESGQTSSNTGVNFKWDY